MHIVFFRQNNGQIRIADMEHVRSELQNSNGSSNSIWKVLNRCLTHKDSQLSKTEDPFSQANKFNENYNSVGISAALKGKPLAEEHGLHSLNDKSIQPLMNSCFGMMTGVLYLNFASDEKRSRKDYQILTVEQSSRPG